MKKIYHFHIRKLFNINIKHTFIIKWIKNQRIYSIFAKFTNHLIHKFLSATTPSMTNMYNSSTCIIPRFKPNCRIQSNSINS